MMKPLLYYNLKCYAFILLLLTPAVVWAQDQPKGTRLGKVPEPALQAIMNLEKLENLANLNQLAKLEELSALASLSSLGSLSSLKSLGDINIIIPDVKVDCASTTFEAETQKTFDKTYKVDSRDMLSIDNKFGRVHVNTWNKNEVRVRVDIKARASNEQRAQELLNSINIAERKEGNNLALKTNIGSTQSSGNRGMEINYTVYMPESNAINIKNKFGDVYLPDFKGQATLEIQHGSLKAERLSNESNSIKLVHGSGRHSSISYMNKGVVDVMYSTLVIDGANQIQCSSKYSDFKIGNVQDVLDLDIKYGSLNVANVSRDVQKIIVDGSYCPITINFEDNSSVNFDVKVQFADFKYDKSRVNVTSQGQDMHSAEYKGKLGSAASKGTVTIVSKFDDVRFAN
ncbi:hypothetical protein LN893_03570 [Pontibacter sp. XAAS-A31]|nr:hypothetical protein [Pontibacter harenae]